MNCTRFITAALLVLKHNDKPLSYAVENSAHIRLSRFTHIAGVKSEKCFYRY